LVVASNGKKPPFKAEIVGSLLRPANLREAREQQGDAKIEPEKLWDIEEQCINEAVALQASVGLQVCTDGDFHRRHWMLDFVEKIAGLRLQGGLPIKFHNESGDIEFSPPRFEIYERLAHERNISVDEFKSLKAKADNRGLAAKQTMPSPMCIHFRGGRAAINAAVYRDMEEFYADLCEVYRQEIRQLYAEGCRYIQVDDTNFPYLCDPTLREQAVQRGEDPALLPSRYVALMNDILRDKPADLIVGIHMCRGNHASAWVAEGGYDPVAEIAFGDMNVDGFFLEYDTARAGSFEPLRFMTGNKIAILGLVTTKKPQLESKDELKRRIDDASRFIPLDRLALSPQCGFASTIEGNRLTPDDQRRKLELVVQTATEVWGTA
jgi:5-methyltetrahydropteroyltriglutamate--homocysteine methyltransferase